MSDHTSRSVRVDSRAMLRAVGRVRELGSKPWRWWAGLLWRGLESGLLVLTGGTLALVGVTVALLWWEGPVGMYLVTATPVAMPMLAAVVTLAIACGVLWTRFKALAVRTALAQGRCPSCDYELGPVTDSAAGQPDEDEGRAEAEVPAGEAMTVCPECGASWRSERVGNTTPERVRVITVERW